jgi:hypothetical protein
VSVLASEKDVTPINKVVILSLSKGDGAAAREGIVHA